MAQSFQEMKKEPEVDLKKKPNVGEIKDCSVKVNSDYLCM